MKTKPSFILPAVLAVTFAGSAFAQTLVGAGSSYTNPFGPADSVLHDVPGAPISVGVSTGTTSKASGIWSLEASGASRVSFLLASRAETSLTGSQLTFGLDNVGLGNALSVGLLFDWAGTSTFSGVNFAPNTRYTISFDVEGHDMLAGVLPSFTAEMIDGNGVALNSTGGASLIDILGLSLLSSGGTGSMSVAFDTGAIAPTGPVGIRFSGGVTVGASILSGDNMFASVGNLAVVASPVPEPGTMGLLVGAVALAARRRRSVPLA